MKLLVITSTPSNPGKKSGLKRAPSTGQLCTDCDSYHLMSDGHFGIKDDEDNEWAIIDKLHKKEVSKNQLNGLNFYLILHFEGRSCSCDSCSSYQ